MLPVTSGQWCGRKPCGIAESGPLDPGDCGSGAGLVVLLASWLPEFQSGVPMS